MHRAAGPSPRPRPTLRTAFLAAMVALGLLLQAGPAAADAPASAALPERIIDIVQITWSGARTPTASDQSVAQVVQTDTISRWRKISNGRVEFTFGTVLPRLQTRVQMPCDSAGSVAFMDAVQTAAYERANVTDTSHRYLVILSPRPTPDCVWDGRGLLGQASSTSGTLLLKDTDDRTVIAHELGHNLGLGHSNFEKCNDGRADGPWENCTAVEYGSATDLMSNNDRSSQLAAYHQWRMGWIADTDVANGNRSLTVRLNGVDTTTGTRAVFVRDRTAAYWIEFRKPDPENGIDAGLVIYRSDPPPGSSVKSPIASDKTDPTNLNVTSDVWMISLGTYRYPAVPAIGSPSLAQGKTFTTAYGGATLDVALNADGTATVNVMRKNTSSKPSRPLLTNPDSWTSPTMSVFSSELDDNGVAILKFEARLTSASGTKIVDIAPSFDAQWVRSYLSPISPPPKVYVKDLPEGRYSLELRAVDALGVASDWSPAVSTSIDLGSPTVTAAFVATPMVDSVQLAWTGATDAGAGICRAQLLNPEGFASFSWDSTEPAVPTFLIAPDATITARGLVYDCRGNGVLGDVSLQTRQLRPASFKRTGTWTATTAGDLRCSGNCSATLITTANASTSIFVRSSADITLLQDGKQLKKIKASGRSDLRRIHIADGRHTVVLKSTKMTLTSALRVASTWQETGTRARAAIADDASLQDSTQSELSKLGFAQRDFIDSITVAPLVGGTSVAQGTLDLCGTDYASETLRKDRRQVVASLTGNYQFVSSETVRYQSRAAVEQAIAELDSHVAKCQRDGYVLTSANAKQKYQFLQLPSLPNGLRPQTDRRVYLVTIGEGADASTLLAAYQFGGDTLNAMYVVTRGANTITVEEQQRWLDVAVVLAQRLTATLSTTA